MLLQPHKALQALPPRPKCTVLLKIARETLGASQKNLKSCQICIVFYWLQWSFLVINQDIGLHLLTKAGDLKRHSTTSGAEARRNPLGAPSLLPRQESHSPLWVAIQANTVLHSVPYCESARKEVTFNLIHINGLEGPYAARCPLPHYYPQSLSRFGHICLFCLLSVLILLHQYLSRIQ